MPIPSKSIPDVQEAQSTTTLMTTKAKLYVNGHHKVAAVHEILSACLVYLWTFKAHPCANRHARTWQLT